MLSDDTLNVTDVMLIIIIGCHCVSLSRMLHNTQTAGIG
jgi:hypothetical protein